VAGGRDSRDRGAEVIPSGDLEWGAFGPRQGARTLFSYLAEEVFARHPDAVRGLVSKLALFERFTPELCEAIGLAGSRSILADLSRQGFSWSGDRMGRSRCDR